MRQGWCWAKHPCSAFGDSFCLCAAWTSFHLSSTLAQPLVNKTFLWNWTFVLCAPWTFHLSTLNSWTNLCPPWHFYCLPNGLLISLNQNKPFVSESLAPLTQLAKWYKEPKNNFQIYRPRNDKLQAIFVFNGDFNGGMARF